MKYILIIGVLVASVIALAQYQEGDTNAVLTVGNHTFTRGELQEKIRRHQAKKHGGMIVEANSAKGFFTVLNAQDRVGLSAIASIKAMNDQWLRFQMIFTNTTEISAANIKSKISGFGGTIGVGIIDIAEMPMLTVAPEDGWALVNVARIAEDSPSQEILESRVRKEVLRGLAFTTGCAYMTQGDPIMRDVKSPIDLDGLPAEQFGLEIVKHIAESAPFYGLTPWNRKTYRKACEEGLAPNPTNDVQQAIWNEVHATPAAPIKIEFDPAKGR